MINRMPTSPRIAASAGMSVSIRSVVKKIKDLCELSTPVGNEQEKCFKQKELGWAGNGGRGWGRGKVHRCEGMKLLKLPACKINSNRTGREVPRTLKRKNKKEKVQVESNERNRISPSLSEERESATCQTRVKAYRVAVKSGQLTI